MSVQTVYTAWQNTTSNVLQFRGVMTEESTDMLANTSLVTFAVQLRRKSGDAILYSWHITATINGSSSLKEGSTNIGTGAVTVATWANNTITHEADGTKTISIPVVVRTSYYDGSATFSFTLSTIPRASSIGSIPSSVEASAGAAMVIVMNRASDIYWHKTTVTFGGSTLYTSAAFGESVSIPVPQSWMTYFPGSVSGAFGVSVQTYAEEACTTAIGSPATATVTITAPADVKPVSSSGWISAAADNTGTRAAGLTGAVRGFSRLAVDFDESYLNSQAQRYGSTMETFTVTAAGKTYTAAISGGAASILTDVLVSDGTINVACTATDSRGRSCSGTLTITCHPYQEPQITGVSIYRSNSIGTETETGGYAAVTATAQISSCGGENTYTLTAKWRIRGGVWSAETALTSGVQALLGAGTLLSTQSYEVQVTLTDALSGSATYTQGISTAEVAFNLRDSNRGAAFGKYAEQDELLEVDYAIKFKTQMTLGATSLTEAELIDVKAAPSAIAGLKAEILDAVYPVGSIYISTAGTNPGTFLGGTWTAFATGRTLVGIDTNDTDFDTSEETGGEKTHTLTVNEMPSHNHAVYYVSRRTVASSGSNAWDYDPGSTSGNTASNILNTGGDQAHNNLQPYITVYMWKRTA